MEEYLRITLANLLEGFIFVDATSKIAQSQEDNDAPSKSTIDIMVGSALRSFDSWARRDLASVKARLEMVDLT